MVLSSEKNLYEILEITPDASPTTIKAAYRRLARKYHPDLNNGHQDSISKFKEITNAYEILSDREKKKNYDILRGFYKNAEDLEVKRKEASRAYKEADSHNRKSSSYTSSSPSSNPSTSSSAADFDTQAFSNVFSDILEGFKKTTSSQNAKFKTKMPIPERGSDVHSDVTISMSEALNGTSRTINIIHSEKCPNCEGRKFINDFKCPLCQGSGEQSTYKKLNVKIPANVKNGSKIRIANEGNRGYNGGKNGDLYLNIKISMNPLFKYDGLNIHSTVPITPFEAVLGATINVPTPEGKVSMKMLPKTHSGQKFRLSNQGLKGSDGKKGDMIVTVNIEIPKNLSAKEIELYEELKKISKEDIRENIYNDY